MEKQKKYIKIEIKDIKFDYNLKIDTVEKVVNEMKNQRQLNLNDEETQIIMEKLSAFRIFIKLNKSKISNFLQLLVMVILKKT